MVRWTARGQVQVRAPLSIRPTASGAPLPLLQSAPGARVSPETRADEELTLRDGANSR